MQIKPLNGQIGLSMQKAQKIVRHTNAPTPSADQLSLSQEAISLSSVIGRLKEQMEIRTPEEIARIEEIGRQIHMGAYQIDSAKVAAKIVDDYLNLNK